MPNYVTQVTEDLAGLLPNADPELLDLYALVALTRGEHTTLEDVHDAWGVWRHRTRPDHASLVPFDRLTPEVQERDRKYMEAIHKVAAGLDLKAA